jgi:hypothetical protein
VLNGAEHTKKINKNKNEIYVVHQHFIRHGNEKGCRDISRNPERKRAEKIKGLRSEIKEKFLLVTFEKNLFSSFWHFRFAILLCEHCHTAVKKLSKINRYIKLYVSSE